MRLRKVTSYTPSRDVTFEPPLSLGSNLNLALLTKILVTARFELADNSNWLNWMTATCKCGTVGLSYHKTKNSSMTPSRSAGNLQKQAVLRADFPVSKSIGNIGQLLARSIGTPRRKHVDHDCDIVKNFHEPSIQLSPA